MNIERPDTSLGNTPTEDHKMGTTLTQEELEDRVDTLLETAPSDELYKQWSTQIATLPLKDQVRTLEDLHQRRRDALASVLPENVPITRGVPDEFVQLLKETLRNARELGRGDNGYVLADPDNHNMAYKFLLRPPIGQQNSLVEEASMQARIREIALQYADARVGVPRLDYFSTDPRTSFIAMERLDAVSVRDVIEGRAALPEGTNIDTAFDGLKRFLKDLNEAHGLYHLDVRAGNIMLPRNPSANNNLPLVYLIDMGMAKTKREVRSVMVIEDGTLTPKIDRVSDCGSVDIVRKRLKNNSES
ncbi:hypothetical protein CL652_00190 [bacterium]|nr:hypothetical protein [bacterium]